MTKLTITNTLITPQKPEPVNTAGNEMEVDLGQRIGDTSSEWNGLTCHVVDAESLIFWEQLLGTGQEHFSFDLIIVHSVL